MLFDANAQPERIERRLQPYAAGLLCVNLLPSDLGARGKGNCLNVVIDQGEKKLVDRHDIRCYPGDDSDFSLRGLQDVVQIERGVDLLTDGGGQRRRDPGQITACPETLRPRHNAHSQF